MSRALTLILLGALLICLLPVAGVLISTAIAELAGCRLDEAGSYPCLVLGHDLGGLLSTLFVSGWFALLTLPFAGLIVMVLGALWLFRLIRRRQSGSVR